MDAESQQQERPALPGVARDSVDISGAGVERVKRGDRFVAFADRPLRKRLFIEVNRVAKDGSWADISVLTWAVMWKKRQKLDERGLPPMADPYEWGDTDMDAQMRAHTEFLEARK